MTRTPFQVIKPTATEIATVDYSEWDLIFITDDKAQAVVRLSREQLSAVGMLILMALAQTRVPK